GRGSRSAAFRTCSSTTGRAADERSSPDRCPKGYLWHRRNRRPRRISRSAGPADLLDFKTHLDQMFDVYMFIECAFSQPIRFVFKHNLDIPIAPQKTFESFRYFEFKSFRH